MGYSRFRTVKSLQPGFIAVISEVALEAVKAKIAASRNPFAAYDYAEALDALISVLPPEAKQDITKRLGVDVDIVVEEALGSCSRDPNAHPYVNEARCLRRVKEDLDKLLRVVFDVAHRRGLFVVEREVLYGGEA
ncbi:hypothetical protein ASQ66_gp11 [Aeropyrum pernix spindle-shaped virus 1]|uniref:Uncharacterized protein n=1 Tax=Aeropyrum pernix (strain ATCC 700893 / DSM 11879 / JCM 9820 / NBRC 100138 / K1) TaxID=272557 RepID=Q9YDT5_AERPE|nr:hypothetical protein [Aeropyrum pernix]YP_009177741.1 hypothetical protein ASQ66_gp11 [Aeropyrum pernix spindle-shaped virus 1]BAA79812.2 hypothetical protein APE_0832.1 [Aeropyrum pernix spindle-shaped virus 1] [Aeropyrum pernix K1]CCD22099.1 TPA: hypothetical protein [Aeropyrum pernix spindle-shaped virus 1]